MSELKIEHNAFDEMKTTLSSLKEKILKLKNICEKNDFKQNDVYEILSEGLIDILDIKHLNSEITSQIEELKTECDKEQSIAEEKELNYHSIMYQKNHIINNIHICNSFQTPEINKIYPHEDKKTVSLEGLNNELLNRKRLNEEYNNLTIVKNKNIEKFTERSKCIKSLPNLLKSANDNLIQAKTLLESKEINKS